MIQEVWTLLSERASFFLGLCGEHLAISLIAIIIAVLIGGALGIFMSEYQKSARLVMPIVNFLYTIPSISMLGFLIPLSGIGNLTAVIALTLYALLPMVRSTYTGLTTVNAGIIEAAEGMGSTGRQILWKITFPLAAPGIVSTSVFAFINAWNDYMIAYTFMKDQSKYTLPVWLSSFSTPTMGTDFGGQMAASVTFSLPVVVFFMLIQRNIMKGVTTGAVK